MPPLEVRGLNGYLFNSVSSILLTYIFVFLSLSVAGINYYNSRRGRSTFIIVYSVINSTCLMLHATVYVISDWLILSSSLCFHTDKNTSYYYTLLQ